MAEKEIMNFDTEVEKVFHMMIHSLYEKKEIFLRELVSNASDACDKLRYQALTKPDLTKGDSDFRILIKVDKEDKTLTISDNGIGMSRADLIKNLGTIARSGTQNFLKNITGDKQGDVNLVGQFGVGFYSSFMVADKVTVVSKAAGGKKAHRWESTGDSKFAIEEIKEDVGRGTTITLHIKDEEKEYLDKFRIDHIVETYSNHIDFDIVFIDEDDKEDILNQGRAIWLKNKSEITEEEYKEFYHSLSHLGVDEPWMTLHNSVEGTVSYKNLLYIPSSKPFDLFNPDRKTQVKLYIKRIFIAEGDIDIIPAYLRFLRGVVDSEDLPLNISRETVQSNMILRRIKNAIVKKVLKELNQKAKKDPESYSKFWENFGPVLKEGLCDAMEPRDDIIDACRFRSTHCDKLVSLEDYIGRMKDGQECIYFITADSIDAAENSPQIEGFRKKGIEVILLTDSVDEFWATVLHEYKGTPLKSVTRASSDLDDTKKDDAEIEGMDNKKEELPEFVGLVDFIKNTLGDAVKDVRTTSRLTDSPVCLTVPDGAMDIRMERFMVANKQLDSVNAKILEINPDHPIIKKLSDDVGDEANKKNVEDVVYLLFAQANIVEGEPLKDVKGFTGRLNEIIEKAMAA